MPEIGSQSGYSLIEVVVVIIILGILASVALQPTGEIVTTVRTEETKAEMERLAFAIAGNPVLVSNGIRTDFGYVGDVGALPPNWDALVTNPGGLSTWNGPYIQDAFAGGTGNNEFKFDGWGAPYSAPGISFSSVGSGETMTRKVSNSVDDLLYNQVTLTVYDLDFSPPGIDNIDSVEFHLIYPNGTGGFETASDFPDRNGMVTFDSVPIGVHLLHVEYIPDNDTITRKINVNPGQHYYGDIQYFADVWRPDTGSTGGATTLEYVGESDTLTSVNCFRLVFWVVNNTGASVDITSLKLTWSSPTAYYQNVFWGGTQVRSGSPALGSGGTAVFSSTRTINAGASAQIRIEQFHRNSNGGGPPVDMTDTDFTVELSDGTTFTFRADLCGG
ncbi:MAG: prepilin-type N-terminal cleavage/methylation domain-containing protein [Candidatus Zixiibacteriota bacterium]